MERDRSGKLRRYLEGRNEIDRIQIETERLEAEIRSSEQKENRNRVRPTEIREDNQSKETWVRRADKSKRNHRYKARWEQRTEFRDMCATTIS